MKIQNGPLPRDLLYQDEAPMILGFDSVPGFLPIHHPACCHREVPTFCPNLAYSLHSGGSSREGLMLPTNSERGLVAMLPGGAVSKTCGALIYSCRFKYPLEPATSQGQFTGCPALLCPWPWCSSTASTSRVEGPCGAEQARALCPLRDTPCWDGVLCGNLLSADGPFMTATPQEHSPRALFAVVVCLQIFPPGSWSRSSVELPLSREGNR